MASLRSSVFRRNSRQYNLASEAEMSSQQQPKMPNNSDRQSVCAKHSPRRVDLNILEYKYIPIQREYTNIYSGLSTNVHTKLPE